MLAALAYAAAGVFVRSIPEGWSDRTARQCARLAHRFHPRARRTLEVNLARLAPLDHRDLSRLSRRTFEQFALALADFLRLDSLSPEQLGARIEIRGAEHLDAAQRSGRGCVLMSVHSGNWEWGAALLASRGVPMRILARPHASARVERFFNCRRAAWGVRTLSGSPLWLETSRALRSGEWVAVMGDRAVPEMRGSLCLWAGALARRTGALLLPVTMTREPDGRHVLWCDAPVSHAAARERGIREALLKHLDRSPGQWYAFAPLPEGLA